MSAPLQQKEHQDRVWFGTPGYIQKWLNTEWTEVEIIELFNDGSGLGFGLIGSKSTGVVVRTILPGGVADRNGRLQVGDHIMFIDEMGVRGMTSEQVATVLRQAGTHVRVIVARPVHNSHEMAERVAAANKRIGQTSIVQTVQLEEHLEFLANALLPPPPGQSFEYIEIDEDASLPVIVGPVMVEETIRRTTPNSTRRSGKAREENISAARAGLQECYTYDVAFERGEKGLGITVAGYVSTSPDVELHGLFVRSVTPGSAADLDARIRVNDQIIQVNGQSLQDLDNHRAVQILKNASRSVNLRLIRYRSGLVFDQLQQAAAVSTSPRSTSSSYNEPQPPGVVLLDSSNRAPSPTLPPILPPPPLPPPSFHPTDTYIPPIESSDHSSLNHHKPHKAISLASSIPDVPSAPLATNETLTSASNTISSLSDSQLLLELTETLDQDPFNNNNCERASSVTPTRDIVSCVDALVEKIPMQPIMMLDRYNPTRSGLRDPPSIYPDIPAPRPPTDSSRRDSVNLSSPSTLSPLDSDSCPICYPQEVGEVPYDVEASLRSLWGSLIPQCDILVAHLTKTADSKGLGISLEGTVDVDDKKGTEARPHHYIRTIIPNGPVGINGRLRKRDELLEVNGKKLYGLHYVEVVKILKNLPSHVRLVCARHRLGESSTSVSTIGSEADFLNASEIGSTVSSIFTPFKAKSEDSLFHPTPPRSETGTQRTTRSRSLELLTGMAMWAADPLIIELVKGSKGLGFSVIDYADPIHTKNSVVVIRSLVPGGVAHQDGRIFPGDRLLFVNDKKLEHARLDTAVAALKAAPVGKVLLGIVKPLPIHDTGTNSAKHTDPYNNFLYPFKTASCNYLSNAPLSTLAHSVNNTTSSAGDNVTPTPHTCFRKSSQQSPPPVVTSPPLNYVGGGVNYIGSSVNAAMFVADMTARTLPSPPLGPSSFASSHSSSVTSSSTSEARLGRSRQSSSSSSGDRLHNLEIVNDNGSDTDALMNYKQQPRADDASLVEPYSRQETLLVRGSGDSVASSNSNNPPIFRLKSDTNGQAKKSLTDDSATLTDESEITNPLSVASDEQNLKVELNNIGDKNGQTLDGVPPVPTSMEKDIRLENRSGPLLLEVDAVSKGKHGGRVLRIQDNALLRTGRPTVGDYVTAVDHKSLRDLDTSRANAVIQNVPPNKTNIVISYIEGSVVREHIEKNLHPTDVITVNSPLKSVSKSITNFPQYTNHDDPTVEAGHVIPSNERRPTLVRQNSGVDQSSTSSVANEEGWATPRLVIIDRKDGASLGISIVGCKVAGQDDRPPERQVNDIFIKQVTPDSAADRSGQLRTGDRILEVNEHNLRRLTHDEAVDIIRTSNSPVRLLVQSLAEPIDEPLENCHKTSTITPKQQSKKSSESSFDDEPMLLDCIDPTHVSNDIDSPMPIQSTDSGLIITKATIEDYDSCDEEEGAQSMPPERVEESSSSSEDDEEDQYGYTKSELRKKYADRGGKIILLPVEQRDTQQGLGLLLAGNKVLNEMNVFVCAITPGGAADSDGRIKVGDELLEINGESLIGRCHLNASPIIMRKQAENRIVKLVLRRDPTNLDTMAVQSVVAAKRLSSTRNSEAQNCEANNEDSLGEVDKPSDFNDFGDVHHATLYRGESGLGFFIMDGSNNNEPGIYIKQVTSGGVAETEGTLQTNDRLLAVNGINVTKINYDSTLDLLRNAIGEVRLTVSRPHKKKTVSLGSSFSTKPRVSLTASKTDIITTNNSVFEEPTDTSSLMPTLPILPIEPGNEVEIEIFKENNLGMSIVGGNDTLLGTVIVYQVYENGAADKDGRLRPGDRILSVDGENLRAADHDHAIEVLRKTGRRIVMKVYRDKAKLKEEDLLSVRKIELVKKTKKGLGISIVAKLDVGVCISDLLKGGAAEQDGRLQAGDLILEINGENVRVYSQEQVATILKRITGKVSLTIGRKKEDPNATESQDGSQGKHHPKKNNTADSIVNNNKTKSPLESFTLSNYPVILRGDSSGSAKSTLTISSTGETNSLDGRKRHRKKAMAPQPPIQSSKQYAPSTSQPALNVDSEWTISLYRGAAGLGFSITGGRDTRLPSIQVMSIYPGGAADTSGQLQPGDRIIRVNDTSLDGLTHSEAMTVLREIKGHVVLTVCSGIKELSQSSATLSTFK